MGSDFYQSTVDIVENERTGEPNLGIGKYCYIDRAIIDKNARIGNHVKIIGGKHLQDGDFHTHSIKDGIVVIKKGAVIPEGTQIG